MMSSFFTVHTRQIKAARALLAWTAEQLAEESGVGVATIRRLEGKNGSVRNLTVDSYEKIISAFQRNNVVFTNTDPDAHQSSIQEFGVAIVTKNEDLFGNDVPF